MRVKKIDALQKVHITAYSQLLSLNFKVLLFVTDICSAEVTD